MEPVFKSPAPESTLRQSQDVPVLDGIAQSREEPHPREEPQSREETHPREENKPREEHQQSQEPLEPPPVHQDSVDTAEVDLPELPSELEPFDWDDFAHRYEAALQEADEKERAVLREAEALSQYFKVWASAASSHDDERVVKRLRSQQRFVNLAEDRMQQKQEHCKFIHLNGGFSADDWYR